jgi:hypothetical protein
MVDTAHGVRFFVQIGRFLLPAVAGLFATAAIVAALITHALSSLRVIEFLSFSV